MQWCLNNYLESKDEINYYIKSEEWRVIFPDFSLKCMFVTFKKGKKKDKKREWKIEMETHRMKHHWPSRLNQAYIYHIYSRQQFGFPPMQHLISKSPQKSRVIS